MSKTEAKFIRTRDRIKDLKTGKTETFPSISAAKRYSRHLQQANGGRGNGYVSVDRSADPKPKRNSKRQDAADKFLAEALRKEQAARVAQEQERKHGPNTLRLSKDAPAAVVNGRK